MASPPPAVAVAKGLFLGSQAALEQLQELGITHVLSVVNYEVAAPDGVCHWRVELEDAEAANLLAVLPEAVAWLERALRQKGSRVLVHCHAGTSRSPAVVVAAVMKAKGLALQQALEVLRARTPNAAPNPGFLAQLELWGEMGCCLDEAHPGYKQFLLDQVARQWEEEGWVDPGSFAELPDDEQELSKLLRYRCRKCRQLAATERNVIPTAGVGRRVFRRQRAAAMQQQQDGSEGTPEPAGGGAEQGAVFLEPMAWMGDQVVGPVQGKLYCTNCQARLGSFNWAGISNTQGAWVVPGFQLHLTRLDAISPRPPAALAGMRFPAALAAHRPPPPPAATAAEPGQQRAEQQQQRDFLPDLQDGVQPAQPQQAEGEQQPCAGGCELQGAGAVASAAAAAAGLQQVSLREEARQQQQQQQQAAASSPCSLPPGAAISAAAEAAAAAAAAAGRAAPGGGAPWFRFLVLDCDGVLVDTEPASCEALRRAILQVTGVDIPHSFPGDFAEVFGRDVRGCIQHYRDKLGRADWGDEDELAAAVQEAKEGHYVDLTRGGIRQLPGAADLIESARALGLAVGVASSGAPAKIARNLGSSGLAPLLDARLVVSASEVARGKPAPDVYTEALRRMGCTDASRALVVEDAVHGLVAARAAGAFAVGVATSLPAEALAPHADLVVGSLEDVRLAEIAPQRAFLG